MPDILKYMSGRYYVIIPNDVYVTKNWLHNLLACMRSNPAIGLVVPMSSNVSNFQGVNFNFTSMPEMQKIAEMQFLLRWEPE